MVVSWFSAGVSSAVATKMLIGRIDRIIYTHIEDQHEDTMRFVKDCESWFGKTVEIIQSPYKNVEAAVQAGGAKFINGPSGAICTRYLKRRVRKEWECDNDDGHLTYVWGLDVNESKPRPPRNISRVEGIRMAMPDQEHLFPLVDASISKEHAHEILRASGITRPAMYDLGYHNNNCVGCVKGGAGYWNKIRVDFPDVFAKRAALERRIGGTCLKRNDVQEGEEVKLYLDELDPKAGRHDSEIMDDCGIMCELMKL